MARILNAPADIANYPKSVILFRNLTLPEGHPQHPAGGRIIEAQWGREYEADRVTVKHPAQKVSFAQNGGGWDKINDLRLGGNVTGCDPDPNPIVPKTSGLTWDEFRSLFTSSELEILDALDETSLSPQSNFTAAQRAKLKSFIQKGIARGASIGIDTTTGGMGTALDYLEARGIIANGRKAEIQAGTVKS